MIVPDPPLSDLLTVTIQHAVHDEIAKQVSRIAVNETREAPKKREEDITKIIQPPPPRRSPNC